MNQEAVVYAHCLRALSGSRFTGFYEPGGGSIRTSLAVWTGMTRVKV